MSGRRECEDAQVECPSVLPDAWMKFCDPVEQDGSRPPAKAMFGTTRALEAFVKDQGSSKRRFSLSRYEPSEHLFLN
jgi:hypothetical protein